MQNETTHVSRQDWWLMALIILAGIGQAAALLYQVITNGLTHPASMSLLLALLIYLAIILLFAWPVRYEIRPPYLTIRSGVIRMRLSLASIEAVRPTRNPAAAPALSLDRLRIDYTRKGKSAFTLVSPKDKRAFLADLVHSTSGLVLDGDGIRRHHE